MTDRPTATEALLEFSRVSKRLGKRQVLDELSLSVASGEAVGLVGLNGAGKTTLIRGLLDLNRIDSGAISIAGLPHTVTAARRHLSYLAERFSPPPFVTGFELLKYLLALRGVSFDTASALREAAALDLDAEALDRPTREYSKGMAQKLGLIASILPATPLIVLDEPLSGLDPLARALFKTRFTALKDAGVSLFFSTHLLIDIEGLCDRIAILNGGRIAWHGKPARLLEQTGTDSLDKAFLAVIAKPN
jgi:ABC-type multidrug transport system ATPase subunit